MSLQANPGVVAPGAQPAKKKGCFFYGCLTALIILIVLIAGTYIGFKYVANKMVEEYTQTTAVVLPPVDTSTASYLKVKERVDSFQSGVRAGTPQSIELSAAEINTYLSSRPGLEGITENFRVAIEGSDLRGIVSIPLDQFGYSDRYLNGMLSLRVSMNNNDLDLRIVGLKVGNGSIPDAALAQLTGENLIEQMEPKNKEELIKSLTGVKSIVVENGLLKMKGGQ